MKDLRPFFVLLVFSFVLSCFTQLQAEEKEASSEPEISNTEEDEEETEHIENMRSRTDAYLKDQSLGNSFKEISLGIRPGFIKSLDQPAGVDKNGFSIGAEVFFFFYAPLGIYIPYTYERFDSNTESHIFGGGPVIRFLDWKFLRGHAQGAALFARAQGANRFGVRFGGDLTFGVRDAFLRPFIGPFVTYERIYQPGQDFTSLMIGLTITLTRLTDLD